MFIDRLCFPTRIAYGKRDLEEVLEQDGSHGLVAELNGQIVAFIVFWVDSEHHRLHLVTLDVTPVFQRRGIGKLLLAEVLRHGQLNRVRTLTLEVAECNQAAIRLYQSFGFRISRRLKAYYAGGANAFRMTRDLEQDH